MSEKLQVLKNDSAKIKSFPLANPVEDIGLFLSDCRSIGAGDPEIYNQPVEQGIEDSQGGGRKLVRIGWPFSIWISRDSNDNLREVGGGGVCLSKSDLNQVCLS